MLSLATARVRAAASSTATLACAVTSWRSRRLRLTASAVAAPFSTSTHAAHIQRTTAIASGSPTTRGIHTSAPQHSTDCGVARTLLVRLEDSDYVAVTAADSLLIAELKTVVRTELTSLKDTPLEAITLHLETAGGAGTGKSTFDATPLAGRKKVAELGPEASIVVKVTSTAKPHAATISADLGTAVAAGETLLRAMLAAKPEGVDGLQSGAKLIRLLGGAVWPQLGAEPLFVRHFYELCAAGAMYDVKRGGRFIIRGNAGIGKSAFGLYLMWRGVNAKRTVVYVSDKAYFGYIFHSTGRVEAFVRTDLLHAAAKVLADSNSLLIFDGDGDSTVHGQGCPPIANATTVVVTSPKRSRYSEFEKVPGVAHLVFPVFSRTEIEDMLETCFPHLHDDAARAGVVERYQKWGGIPRYVLTLLEPFAQDKLDNALTAIDLDRLADVLGRKDIEDDSAVSHRLVHLKPAGETADGFVGGDKASAYYLDRSELGSFHIAKMVYTAMQTSQSNKLLTLLAQPTKGTQLAKLYGDVFQQHALDKLAAGSTDGFDTYALGSSGSEGCRLGKLQLPASEIMFFSKVDQLTEAGVGADRANRIWVPRPSNFASIDLVLPGQRLANFTINEEHKLLLFAKNKTQGLVPVATALGIPAQQRIPFYWIMPRERFDLARKRGSPFPVAYQGASPKTEGGVVAGGGDDVDATGSTAADGGVSDRDSVATGRVAPCGRHDGHLKKRPGAAAVLSDYEKRIDQFLLLVPFDVLKLGMPTPRPASA